MTCSDSSMLEDIAAHVLDIAQNGIAAEATHIDVTVRRNERDGLMEFEVLDNGKGMSPERVAAVIDPFCTSRTTRRVGMGLPFLKQNAELCGGSFSLTSQPGKGTRVYAGFALKNIDTPPLGDLAGAFLVLLMDAPRVRWMFKYEILPDDGGAAPEPFELDSEELAEAVDGLDSLKIPDVALGLREMMQNGIRSVY